MNIPDQPNINTSEEVLCEIAEQYSQSVLITVVQYCHITMSSLALLALASNLPLSFLWHKKLGVHLNLKLILINLSILYALHSISFIIAQTYNQYLYRFHASNPCDLLIVRWKCLSYRTLSHLAYIGVTCSQLGIVYERAYASLYPSKYEACSGKIGIATIVITWVSIAFGLYYLIYDEVWNALVPYCTVTDWKTNPRIIEQYMVLLAVDLFVTITHIFITIYNKNQLQKRFEWLALYNLHRACQLRRNLRTMHVFLPLSAMHSFIFIIFMAAFTIVRSQLQYDMQELIIRIECFSTIFCIYCFLMPAVFFVIRKKLYSKKIGITPSTIQSELYFNALEAYWRYRDSTSESGQFRRITQMVILIKKMSKRRIAPNRMYQNTN